MNCKVKSKQIFIGIFILALLFVSLRVVQNVKLSRKPLQENFTNEFQYQKYSETAVPVIKTEKNTEKLTSNLDNCKARCNEDDDCVGFVRKKTADDVNDECYFIKNVINCHNEFKEPSENYLLAPGITEESHTDTKNFFEYDTYLKLDVRPAQKDNIQKCIRLDQMVGMSPRKYPFSLLVLDDNNNLSVMGKDKHVMDLKELEEELFYSKYAVISIVKGLSGSGVSFKVNKKHSDYYIVRKGEGENLSAELEEDSLIFKQRASFIMDMEFAEQEVEGYQDVKYVSIKHQAKGVVDYWKVNDVTQKVVLENNKKLGDDKEGIMFQFKDPLPYKEEKKEEKKVEVPSPSATEPIELEGDNVKEMSDELEQLELDIRETQHQQNVKLMNIMLEVNKFKLHDLSMSDYLTQCTKTSAEPPSYVDTQIKMRNSQKKNLQVKQNNTNNTNTNNTINTNNTNNNTNNNNQGNRMNTMIPVS